MYFFLQKDIARTKTLASKNKLTKQKQTNTKQQRQQFFASTDSSEDESHLFCPSLHQHLDSNPSILFICILTNFHEVVPTTR